MDKTLDQLVKRVDYQKRRYAKRNEMFDTLTEYYFIEQPTAEAQEEEGVEMVKLSDAPNAVELIQDLFAHAGYTTDVPAGSENKTDREIAEVAEKFLQVIMKQSELAIRQPLLDRISWDVAMRGCTAGRVRVVLDWLDKDEVEETGSATWGISSRIPVLIQPRDPRFVYPAFGKDGLLYVVESESRSVEDVQISYGEDVLAGRAPDDIVLWEEYWDGEVYCYWADGTPVPIGKGGQGPWPHRYGLIPYCFEFGRQTSDPAPEKRVRPMLEAQRGVLDKNDMLAGMWLTFVADYIGNSWILWSDDLAPDDIDLTTGSVIPLSPSKQEKLESLQKGRMPPELEGVMAMLGQRWEQGTFPKTLFGQDIGGSAAGYMVSLLNRSGQARMNSLIGAVERLMADLCRVALEVTHNYVSDLTGSTTVPFYWLVEKETDEGATYKARDMLKLDTAKLKGQYEVNVNLGPTMPDDEAANANLANQYRQPGVTGRPLLSDVSLRQQFNLAQSSSDEDVRIDREMAMASPEVQGLIMQVLSASVQEELLNKLRSIGVDTEIAKQMAAAGQPGPPPLEEMPPEMMGMGQGMMAQPDPAMMDPGMQPPIDPATGMPMDPAMLEQMAMLEQAGMIDPATGMPMDPAAGALMQGGGMPPEPGAMPPLPGLEEEMI